MKGFGFKSGLQVSDEVDSVKSDPWNISLIRNPSHEAQLTAVRCDGNVICYIANPS